MHSALHLSLDCEETQKRETHFIAFCIVQCAFGLRRSNWRCGCRNGGWCTQRRDLARPNCDLYVFGPSRKHFISTHSLPTVFIRANPRDPLLLQSRSSTDPIRSALPLLPPAPSPSSSYPDVIYTHHRGKGFVGPIASRTIKIGGHIAKCPADRRVAHRNGSDWLSV